MVSEDKSTPVTGSETVSGQVLPPAEEKAIREIVKIEMQQVRYSGPLPQASEFRHYEETLPGAADRILAMAEKEQAARLKAQEECIREDNAFKKRGQLFAGGLALIFCILAGWLILKEQYIAAAAVLGMIAGLAYVFISGRYKSTNDSPPDQETRESD